jgi:hypothetical protein
MALYSLNHKSIGKSTQERPYTAAAHIDYITRAKALGRLEGARMPVSKEGAIAFFKSAEDRDRKNARVADKVMLALPRELTTEQRVALVRSFAEEVTDGRASWIAAIHDRGKDVKNPHCHLVIRDRDTATGRRVFGMSESGSTQRLRVLWEAHANLALARANRKERIDRRTLKAQGIDRRPMIHIGVRSREMIRTARRPASRVRQVRNHCQARSRSREVDFPAIDSGKTRMDYNLGIIRGNIRLSRVQRREAEFWEAVDRDAFKRDMDMLRRAHGVVREKEFGRAGPGPEFDLDMDL